jgi:hypothetical protein
LLGASQTPIKEITYANFKDLTELQYLILEATLIETLTKDMFKDLVKLIFINLGKIRIRIFDFLMISNDNRKQQGQSNRWRNLRWLTSSLNRLVGKKCLHQQSYFCNYGSVGHHGVPGM